MTLPSLPSADPNRLPPYKGRTQRYHPYARYPLPPPPYEDDAFFHTVFDEHCEVLDVPLRGGGITEQEGSGRRQVEGPADHVRLVQRPGPSAMFFRQATWLEPLCELGHLRLFNNSPSVHPPGSSCYNLIEPDVEDVTSPHISDLLAILVYCTIF